MTSILNTHTVTSVGQQFWAGVRAELPIIMGVIPFGLIFGINAVAAGLNPAVAWSMSSIVFAGSAQFLAIPLLAEGTPALIMLMTTLIINLRHLLYSASLTGYSQKLPMGWKIINSYLLTDEAFAPTIVHYQDENVPVTHKHWFWFGAGITLWTQWQISTGIGIFLGTQVPDSLGLDFTLALTFIGIVMPTLLNRPAIGAALSAGITALLLNTLPYKLNLMAAAIVGIAVGLALETWQSNKNENNDMTIAVNKQGDHS